MTKRLIEIKFDQHNCILKHSRKVTSCQTCLGVCSKLVFNKGTPDLQPVLSLPSLQYEKLVAVSEIPLKF